MLPVIEITRRNPRSSYGRFTFFYAKKDGGLFLREEKTTWWDINGFMLQTGKHKIICVFKRDRLDRALRAINHR